MVAEINMQKDKINDNNKKINVQCILWLFFTELKATFDGCLDQYQVKSYSICRIYIILPLFHNSCYS